MRNAFYSTLSSFSAAWALSPSPHNRSLTQEIFMHKKISYTHTHTHKKNKTLINIHWLSAKHILACTGTCQNYGLSARNHGTIHWVIILNAWNANRKSWYILLCMFFIWNLQGLWENSWQETNSKSTKFLKVQIHLTYMSFSNTNSSFCYTMLWNSIPSEH